MHFLRTPLFFLKHSSRIGYLPALWAGPRDIRVFLVSYLALWLREFWSCYVGLWLVSGAEDLEQALYVPPAQFVNTGENRHERFATCKMQSSYTPPNVAITCGLQAGFSKTK